MCIRLVFFLAAVVQLPHGGLHREVADGSRGEGVVSLEPLAEALRSPARIAATGFSAGFAGFATAAIVFSAGFAGFAVARIIEAVKK